MWIATLFVKKMTGDTTMLTCMYLLVYLFLTLLNYIYTCRFADRDMMMRYRGGGVGHIATRGFTKCLEENALSLCDTRALSNNDLESLVCNGSDAESEISSGAGEDEDDDEDDDYFESDDDGEYLTDDNVENLKNWSTGSEAENLELEELGPEDGEVDDLGAEEYDGYAEF
jgi:hypothetical protein